METLIAPHSFCPLFNPKTFSKTLVHPTLLLRSSNSFILTKPICSSNFCLLVPGGPALASEFDVLNDGQPKESYVVDDAGVLRRVTKSNLKQ
ncbi:hypothetical protein RJ639_040814 [Escallonia herrerae]|uniref:Uncharacterized protein n=1 Tax=Escallonia herrerae TaxID=1293975 RepID=A0AA88WH19_9ASTE|nr:hypothetical protein RJ639_040814 [Escallonia herrerae]